MRKTLVETTLGFVFCADTVRCCFAASHQGADRWWIIAGDDAFVFQGEKGRSLPGQKGDEVTM